MPRSSTRRHWTRTRLRWRCRRSGTIPAASRSWVPMTFSSNLRMAAPGRLEPSAGRSDIGSCAPIPDIPALAPERGASTHCGRSLHCSQQRRPLPHADPSAAPQVWGRRWKADSCRCRRIAPLGAIGAILPTTSLRRPRLTAGWLSVLASSKVFKTARSSNAPIGTGERATPPPLRGVGQPRPRASKGLFAIRGVLLGRIPAQLYAPG
jgi:hypothetical protein